MYNLHHKGALVWTNVGTERNPTSRDSEALYNVSTLHSRVEDLGPQGSQGVGIPKGNWQNSHSVIKMLLLQREPLFSGA